MFIFRAWAACGHAAILVFQNNPVGVELFSYVNAFFCSHKFAEMLAG